MILCGFASHFWIREEAQPLFSLHFNEVQHCTVLNLRKFSYTGLSYLSLNTKSKAKSVFVVETGE